MSRPATPPGPRGWWGLRRRRAWRGNPLAFGRMLSHEFGDVVHFRVLGKHYYQFTHPDVCREILIGKPNLLRAPACYPRLFANPLECELSRCAWKQGRFELPAFSPAELRSFGQSIARATRDRFQRRDVPIVNIRQVLSHLSMESLALLIFGPAIQTELSGLHRLAAPLQTAGSRDARPASSRSRPMAGDTRALCVPMLTQLRRLIAPVAGNDFARRGSEHTWPASVHEAATSESILALDPDAVWDAALGVLLAGQRALADTLTWAVYLLATHPDVRRRLATEVTQVHGSDGVRVARGHLQVEAERVLAETLRLFPPVPWAVRVTAAPTILGGHAIRSGATCLVPVQLLQRDPRWHANPDEFRPDRFAGPSADTTARAYQPFGGDPATCILRQFVMLGGAMVLAALLQRYDWTLVEAFSPPSTEALAAWRWTHGPFVQLHARHRSAVHWRVPKEDGK